MSSLCQSASAVNRSVRTFWAHVCFAGFFAAVMPMAMVHAADGNQSDDQSGGPPTALQSGDGHRKGVIVIEALGDTPEPQLLHTGSAEATVRVGEKEITQSIELTVKVVQGKPGTVSYGLRGNGRVVSVKSDELLSWSVRQTGGERFLDLRVKEDVEQARVNVTMLTKIDGLPISVQLPHLGKGDAIGFESMMTVQAVPSVRIDLLSAKGFVPLESADGETRLQTSTGGTVRLRVGKAGAALAPVEWSDTRVSGTVEPDSRSSRFVFSGTAQVNTAGASATVLSGDAAISRLPQDDDFRLHLTKFQKSSEYQLTFPREGEFAVEIEFVARLKRLGDGRHSLDFRVAGGAVMPIVLEGLAEDLEFESTGDSVVPKRSDGQWVGFLPASGRTRMIWKTSRQTGEGKLFFTTSSLIEASVGAGLLRQDHEIEFQVLQGELRSIDIDMHGPGEILDVSGKDLVSWKVEGDGGKRTLHAVLSSPITATSRFTFRSQTPLSAFPVRVEGLRLDPAGAIRHSGHIRLSNSGSVRLEPTDLNGLNQLSPDQFPGGSIDARQIFVYRFPSAEYSFTVVADRIQPEVNVAETVLYQLAETDRTIVADVELDIREAKIRDWDFSIPGDYSVVAVTGASVADYIASGDVVEGQRNLKVIFAADVIGRQLVTLQLEKNQPAEAGPWTLPVVKYPGVKSVRGDIGIVATPGFRTVINEIELLVEKPLSYFPKPVANLQHAFRIRELGWNAVLQIEPLDRNVQSDAFHLYSLSQGTVYGSALINYFVTGAPVSQWRLTVPESLGNVMVDGQDIRTWQREGETLIVSLHQPVMGAYTLLVTFEKQPDKSSGEFAAGLVTPLDVQSERGFIQVVSPMQVEMTTSSMSEDLLVLDPLELPAEFRLLSTSPSLGTWQYTERPFALNLNVEWFEPGTMVTQVVEFAEANSRVSKDGELVTDVVYFVKSRGRRTLQIELPAEPVKLWAVSVNDRPVTARRAGDATLIPLPGGTDPNEPVRVSLRLGKPAVSPSKAELTLPTIMAPVLKTQWKVVGDEKLVLVPSGGTVEPTTPVRSASGFDWVARYGLVSLGAILVLVAAGVWCGGRGPFWTGGELLGYLAAIGVALMTAVVAFANVDPLSQLQLNMPILAAGETVMLEVENVPSWRVDLSVVGLVLAVIGAALMLGGFLVRSSDEQRVSAKSVCLAAGALLVAIGVLCQGGSAGVFFMLVALAIAVLFFLPRSRVSLRKGTERWKRWNEKRAAAKANAESADASGSSGVVASIGLGCLVALSGASVSHAKETERSPFIAADSILQVWEVSRDEHRLRVTGEIKLSGHPGDQFLLLKSPATLTRFEGEGLRLSKTEVHGEGLSYVVSIPIAINKGDANSNDGEADGGDAEDEGDDGDDSNRSGDGEQPDAPQTYRASFEYQLEAVDAMKSIPVLTGAASVSKVDVSLDVAGWEIFCDAAVMIEQDKDSDKTSGSVLLGPGKAAIVLKPKARDVASEETRFFVEASNLYRPGPGVVDGRHRFQIRPSQGQVSELNCTVPEGLTVSRVAGPVSAWQFDADLGRLHLQITPSQSAPFSVTVDTQRSLEALPADLTLSPMRVLDAGGEVGLLAIAFGPDAQPEKATPTKMSAVNLGDFDSEIMWQKSDVLHRVFRYGADGGSVQLRVVPVQPDVRVVTQQALSLGDERIVLNVNCLVDITRAGLFQLSFPLPDGLEVETISGDALHHWSETNEDDRRQIVLHLNGKSIGKHSFAIVLSGASPSSQREWSLPRFEIAEADRQTGELVVRPTTGIRLRTVARQNISEMDPRQATGNRKSGSAGLAFRLLQQDWRLTLGIDQLDPWVTGQVLHQITLREGQTRSTLVGNFKVENASIRELQVVLPIDDEGEIKTLRASGKAVSDLVRVQPNANVWQIQFKRRVLGKVEFRIEYERRGERDDDTELLVPVEFPEIRQLAYYYGVRAGGRLEVDYAELTPGWQRVDWNTIPSSLRMAENHTVPALSLRAVSPDAPLAIRASRHSLADALKLRVAEGTFATILSPTGDQLTAVDMTVEVIQRSSLSVGLPAESELFNVFVNGESVHTIRQGGQTNAWQFYILAGIDDRTAKVRFVYSVPGDGIRRIRLRSPEMNVPLENIRWNVLAPEGFELTDSDGNLELIEQENRSVYDRASYLSKMKGKRQNQAAKAAELLEQANQLLRSGEQKKASWAFNNVANQFALDAASNEDARVQLENLQTQQAIVGLNTRRQRLYMDNYENEAVPAQDEQLRQAAADNPILQQAEMNFRPQQLSELLRGNTIEDNAVLQAIAYRLVQHQRATETAPQAILINLPEEGTMYAFTRTVSVTENEPLELDLQFESRYRVPMWQSGLLGLLLAAIASVIVYARKR